MALSWPNKDPEEQLDYPVNFADWLALGAAISNAQVVIDSTVGDDTANPLLIDTVQFTGTLVNVWLTGGVEGVSYVFKVTVEDDTPAPGPRIGVRRVKLKIKEK